MRTPFVTFTAFLIAIFAMDSTPVCAKPKKQETATSIKSENSGAEEKKKDCKRLS